MNEISAAVEIKRHRLYRAAAIAASHGEKRQLSRIVHSAYTKGVNYTEKDVRLDTHFGLFCLAHGINSALYLKLKQVELSLHSLEYTYGGGGEVIRPFVDRSMDVSSFSLSSYCIVDFADLIILEEVVHLLGFEEFQKACRDPSAKYCRKLKHFIKAAARKL